MMPRVLVDTSVWRHFFAGKPDVLALDGLLDRNEVELHPLVFGELLLGGLSRQEELHIGALPSVDVAAHRDVVAFIRRHRLARAGIGWVDASILTSALAGGRQIWSKDQLLAKAAARLDVAFEPLQ